MVGYRAFARCTFVAVLSMGGLLLSLQSLADPVAVELPTQPLAGALREFARQTGVQVAIPAELTAGKMSVTVKGSFEPAEALNRLLKGSGLIAYPVNHNTYGIRSESSAGRTQNLSARPAADSTSADPNQSRLAQISQSGSFDTPGSAEGSNAGKESPGLADIIVTAQKRSERLQDVPVPVTAISADSLVDANQNRLQDYYSSVPGLDLALDNRGAPALSIRGLSTGVYNNSTVGITVDDVPFGASTVAAFSWAAADFDPNELARVEVLRGPQGTLYGVDSLGGLIKYVTVDPSTDGFSGRLQVGGTDVRDGYEAGYTVSGAVNVPLSDTLAVRASAFTRLDPGYVDNLETGQRGVNWGDTSGGRLSSLWRPSENLSVKLSALFQESDTHGSSYVEPTLGDLQQSAVRDTGGYDRTIQAYNATVSYKWGAASLTSVTGYGINKSTGSYDVSALAFLTSLMQSNFGVTGSPWEETNKTDKFSQELRLSVPLSERIDWLIGAFYTHEASDLDGGFVAADPFTGAIVEQAFTQFVTTSFAEYAAFTDLTFHFTDEFSVQIGGRESHNRQLYNEVDVGPLVPDLDGYPSPYIYPRGSTDDNSFTYLVTPQLKLSSDLMVYARVASGYRPGGPNIGVAPGTGIPVSFSPDKTENYELGVKGNILDHMLSFDASIYHIDWRDIQISEVNFTTGSSYDANSGRAKSQGVEISVSSTPFTGWRLAAWVSLNDAELTEAFPTNSAEYGAAGDQLPYSSRFSGNLSSDYDFPINGRLTATLGATETYVGSREGEFAATAERQTYPSYAKTDLRLGVRWDSWRVHGFITNVEDKRGLISGGLATNNPLAFTIIQPRTIGMALTKTF